MYSDIGKKIKTVGIVVCLIGIIASIEFGKAVWTDFGVTLGIVVIVGGSLLSWLFSFFFYGFGEMIDRITSIDNKLININSDKMVQHLFKTMNETQIPDPNEWKCSCGKTNPLYVGTCSCGKDKDGVIAMVPKSTVRTVKCPNCGAEENKSHTMCYKCGTKLA